MINILVHLRKVVGSEISHSLRYQGMSFCLRLFPRQVQAAILVRTTQGLLYFVENLSLIKKKKIYFFPFFNNFSSSEYLILDS